MFVTEIPSLSSCKFKIQLGAFLVFDCHGVHKTMPLSMLRVSSMPDNSEVIFEDRIEVYTGNYRDVDVIKYREILVMVNDEMGSKWLKCESNVKVIVNGEFICSGMKLPDGVLKELEFQL